MPVLLGMVFVEEHTLRPWSVSDHIKQHRNDRARFEQLPAVLMKVLVFKRCYRLSTAKQRSWRCTAWVCRIRHCPTLPRLLDPEDALPGSSGLGIVPLFLDCLTLNMHCLDLQDQALFLTSVNSYQSIRCNILEDLNFQVKLLIFIFWYLRFRLLDKETEDS